MGRKLAEIEVGSRIKLHVSNADNKMTIDGIVQKVVKEDILIIDLDYEPNTKLNFRNVRVDLEHCFSGKIPILWRNIRIANYKDSYAIQSPTDGVKFNRRGSFRVGVGSYAHFRRKGHGAEQVVLRDISVSGFSITDKSKNLNFIKGDKVVVKFSDLGFTFELYGRVVRSEEYEHMTIYGLEICNFCKGLSNYVHLKQRTKK